MSNHNRFFTSLLSLPARHYVNGIVYENNCNVALIVKLNLELIASRWLSSFDWNRRKTNLSLGCQGKFYFNYSQASVTLEQLRALWTDMADGISVESNSVKRKINVYFTVLRDTILVMVIWIYFSLRQTEILDSWNGTVMDNAKVLSDWIKRIECFIFRTFFF